MVGIRWPSRDRSRDHPWGPPEHRLRRLKRAFPSLTKPNERAAKDPKLRWVAVSALAALGGFAAVWAFTNQGQLPRVLTGNAQSGTARGVNSTPGQLPRVITPAYESSLASSRVSVLDGDTIRLDDRKPDVAARRVQRPRNGSSPV